MNIRTKIRQSSDCLIFIHCESNGIITRQGAYHQPQAVYAFAMMICRTLF
ncbi:MAG: hypothetical protein IKK37_00435 [Clostridia bacterium]|nr:hypothetical protein [Clostridia bacterium]